MTAAAVAVEEYQIYRVTIRNPRDQVTWRFDIAAPHRKAAQDAGEAWKLAHTSEPEYHRVSVMLRVIGGTVQKMLVVVG